MQIYSAQLGIFFHAHPFNLQVFSVLATSGPAVIREFDWILPAGEMAGAYIDDGAHSVFVDVGDNSGGVAQAYQQHTGRWVVVKPGQSLWCFSFTGGGASQCGLIVSGYAFRTP